MRRKKCGIRPPWVSLWNIEVYNNAFLDEPSGQSEREEGTKVIRKYALFTNIGSSAHEVGLVAPRTYVQEAMNIGSQ